MNGVNFFTWIRDGVRQSVLLGVSDAVEQLGTPASSEEIHPSVAGILAPTMSTSAVTSVPGRSAANSNQGRKRLGRSLKEMNSSAKPTE